MSITNKKINYALRMARNFVLGTALLVASSTPNFAQTATPAETDDAAAAQTSTPSTGQQPSSQNWLKLCNTLDDGKKACFLRQLKQNGDQFGGSFVLRDDPLQENRLMIVAAVPLGVLLPFGLRLQIDSQKPDRLPYLACDPQTCAAQAVINEAFVDRLKRGNVLRITAKNRRNKDYVVEIDLAGFTATYDGEGLDIQTLRDQASQPADGKNIALEQKLLDEAEKIRKDREAAKAAKAAEENDGSTAD